MSFKHDCFGSDKCVWWFSKHWSKNKKTWVNGKNRVKSTINSGWNNKKKKIEIEQPSPLIYLFKWPVDKEREQNVIFFPNQSRFFFIE